MFHLAAYFRNIDMAGADTYLNAVADNALFTSGFDVRVPPNLTSLWAEMLTSVAATKNYWRVESPSMRALVNQDGGVFNGAVTGMTDTYWQMHQWDPRTLIEAESVNILVNSDDAGAQDFYGLILLGDGPAQAAGGKILTVRATATIAQASGVWVNGQLTFTQKLPVADYQVVGMRCVAASGIAARLVFPGQPWRPGCNVSSAATIVETNRFRYGNLGIWGQFDINQPPQLEMLGGAAAAQTVYLDLLKLN